MKSKVLVIDDEAHVAEALAMVLCIFGYDVRTENSGTDGLAQAALFHPDIVICDVMMPVVNGVDTVIQIDQQLPGRRIFLISAVPEFAVRLMAERGMPEAFQVLPKPIAPRDLLYLLGCDGNIAATG